MSVQVAMLSLLLVLLANYLAQSVSRGTEIGVGPLSPLPRCYSKRVNRDTRFQGSLQIRLVVHPDGKAEVLELGGLEVGDEEFEDCLGQPLARIRFGTLEAEASGDTTLDLRLRCWLEELKRPLQVPQ